jgi:hypothetical protein
LAKKSPEQPIVHVHPSRFPNDPIEIIANEVGMERLINTLIDALSFGRAGCEIESSDGFSSEVRAVSLQGHRRAEEWTRAGSPYWDIDDPMVARILDLTEENRRLRDLVSTLRLQRQPIPQVEYRESPEDDDA